MDERLSNALAKHTISNENFFDIIKNMEITCIPAEEVLIEDKEYQSLIRQWMESGAYKKRELSELKGYVQLVEGTYGKQVPWLEEYIYNAMKQFDA